MSNRQFRVPPGTEPALADFLDQFVRYTQSELDQRRVVDSAEHSTVLISPDGSAWEIVVDDTGTITTTRVQG